MDLVLGIYERDKHLQDIVLIPSSEINQGPRMEVWTAGRNPNCDMVFQHPSIHGFHFELEVDKVSRRVWVTNLTLMRKLSVAEIVIRPQCTEQFYPGEILKVGDSSQSFKLEVIPSVYGQEEESYDSKHQESYVDGSAPHATLQLCEKIIETIDRLQTKWKQDEIATGSTVEHDTTAMKEPLLPRSFTPQCMVKPKEGGNGTSENLLNSLQRKAMRETVTSSISDQGEQVEEILGCTKKELVPTPWKEGPTHSSMGSQKGHTRIIQEDNLIRAWGQAWSKEGGSDTCLILAPSRTAEGLAVSARAEPTSSVSSSWARRLPPDRLMSLLPGEVSLGRESREQQATAWCTVKDGRKPKKRLAGLGTSTYVRRAKCMRNPWALLIMLQWEERVEQLRSKKVRQGPDS
ncbi:FHA domain-containing protein [Nymphaea thermarum]|nr:FHA domain-containing protein [Nymphaea thermarum]